MALRVCSVTKFQISRGQVLSPNTIAPTGAAKIISGSARAPSRPRVCGAGKTFADYRAYADRVLAGVTASTGEEMLTPEMKRAEAIALGLRTGAGVPIEWVEHRPNEIAEFVDLGLLQRGAESSSVDSLRQIARRLGRGSLRLAAILLLPPSSVSPDSDSGRMPSSSIFRRTSLMSSTSSHTSWLT